VSRPCEAKGGESLQARERGVTSVAGQRILSYLRAITGRKDFTWGRGKKPGRLSRSPQVRRGTGGGGKFLPAERFSVPARNLSKRTKKRKEGGEEIIKAERQANGRGQKAKKTKLRARTDSLRWAGGEKKDHLWGGGGGRGEK